MILSLLLLPSCGGMEEQNQAEELALTIRGEYLALESLSASMDVTADYGARVYDFALTAAVSGEETVLTVRLLIQFSHRMERFARSSRSSAEQRDIDRAKRALMEKKGLTEEEAHHRLQKRSMDEGRRLVQTARQVLAELEEPASER